MPERQIIQLKRARIPKDITIRGRHIYARRIRELFLDGKLQVVSVSPYNEWVRETEKDLLYIESICTYEACVRVTLTQDNKVELLIEDGDNLNGQPTHRRCTFTLEGEWWLHEYLAEAVWDAFFSLTKALVKKEEEARLEARRQIIEGQVLEGTYSPQTT